MDSGTLLLHFWIRLICYRFDGVTTMLLNNNAIGELPTSYSDYFGPAIDVDALRYLTLANYLLHELYPFIVTIAEGESHFYRLFVLIRQMHAAFRRYAGLQAKAASASTTASAWACRTSGRSRCLLRYVDNGII